MQCKMVLTVTIQFKDDRALRALSTSLWCYLASLAKSKQKISGSVFLLIYFVLRSWDSLVSLAASFCLVTPRCVTKTVARQTYEILTVFGGRSGEKFCSDTVTLRCICQDRDAVLRKLGQVLQFCCSCSRGNILCFKSVFTGGFFVHDTIPKDNAVLMVRGDWAPVNEQACWGRVVFSDSQILWWFWGN